MSSASEPTGNMKGVQRRMLAWLRWQSLIALALTGILLAVDGTWALSALLGGLAALLPTLLFTLVVGSRIGGDSGAFLRTAALAQVGKLLLTGILCAVVFVAVEPLAPGWFFAGMITVLVTGWLGLSRLEI